MRKIIAVLEGDEHRAQAMTAWLDDRLYMYEKRLAQTPALLIEAIKPALADLLVLCLGRETLNGSGVEGGQGGRSLFEFLQSQPVRFPILIHSILDPGPDQTPRELVEGKWHVDAIGPVRGPNWFGDEWYPALKRSLRLNVDSEPVKVHDNLGLGRFVG